MNNTGFISDLYFGRITPWEKVRNNNPEYNEAVKIKIELISNLEKILDSNQKQLLEELLMVNDNLNTYSEEEKFKDGFILGTNMMLDVFNN